MSQGIAWMITRPSECNRNLGACAPAQPDRVPGQNELCRGPACPGLLPHHGVLHALLTAPPPKRSPPRPAGRGGPVEIVFPGDAKRAPVERTSLPASRPQQLATGLDVLGFLEADGTNLASDFPRQLQLLPAGPLVYEQSLALWRLSRWHSLRGQKRGEI
jgi:hypothetical protein